MPSEDPALAQWFADHVLPHEPMLRALRELFDACAVDDRISFDYDTRIFAGQPA